MTARTSASAEAVVLASGAAVFPANSAAIVPSWALKSAPSPEADGVAVAPEDAVPAADPGMVVGIEIGFRVSPPFAEIEVETGRPARDACVVYRFAVAGT
ncbi:MAG TPA: hypothetical protein VGX96_08655 [Candidatus Elarobacter sp.]|nr:hypothetical protein [Candidatus Elarobacter sp.]